MFDSMSLKKRLATAFSMLIFILIIMTSLAVKQMNSISNFTQLLYKHPFAVSVAIVKIEAAVTSMHRSMKDVALSNSIEQINNAASKVAQIEKQTLKYFDVLEERFLGDQSDIKMIRASFISWGPIRNEVITLMKQGKKLEAANITKEKGADHIKVLNQRLEKLELFAANKASEFTNNSLKEGNDAVINLIILVTIAIILAVLLSWRIAISILRPIGGEPKDIEQLTHKIAEGDLSIQFKNTGKETGIYSAMQTMVAKLKVMMVQISDSATSQTIASERLAIVSNQTKNNITEQSHATDQVATAITQMHATSEEVANNTSIATEATEAAKVLVDTGTLKVEQSATKIKGLANDLDNTASIISELAESTEDITEILEVIKGISDQTNLLALNAAIEAARAGELGRGFSVVADEVRTLASNTQKSTAEIEAKIIKVQEGAQNSVNSMTAGREQADIIVKQTVDVQQALLDIKNAVYQIIEMNSQIAFAAKEQSSVAEEVGKQVIEIKNLSNDTGSGAEDVRLATEELTRFATELNNYVSKFKI